MLENILSLKVQGGYFVNETDDFPLFQNTLNILYGRNGSGVSFFGCKFKRKSNTKQEKVSKRLHFFVQTFAHFMQPVYAHTSSST